MRSSGHLRYEKLVIFLTLRFRKVIAYTAILISLHLLGFSPFESSLVNEVRKLFLHEVIDYLYSLVEAFFASAGDVKVKRRFLQYNQ